MASMNDGLETMGEVADFLREVADGIDSERFQANDVYNLLYRCERKVRQVCQCGNDKQCCPITIHGWHTSPHYGCFMR